MEQKIKAVMAETGMQYVQAYYHVKARETLMRGKREYAWAAKW